MQSPCGENHVKFVLGFSSPQSDSPTCLGRRGCCHCRSQSRVIPFSPRLRHRRHLLPVCFCAYPRESASPSAEPGAFQLCSRPNSWWLWEVGDRPDFRAAFLICFQGEEKMWSWPQSEHTDSWVPVVAEFLEAGWRTVAKRLPHLLTHSHLLSSLGSPPSQQPGSHRESKNSGQNRVI